MELKIISDGTTVGTKLVDAATGEKIQYVQSIEWEIDAKTLIAYATIKLAKVPIETTLLSNINEFKLDPPTYTNLNKVANSNENVKISSDGTNAKIISDNGKQLAGVQNVNFKVDVSNDKATCYIDKLWTR